MGKHGVPSRTRSRSASPVLRALSTSLATTSARVRLPRLRKFSFRPLFSAAFVVTVSVLFVNMIDPYSGAVASPYYQPVSFAPAAGQTISIDGTYINVAGREGITLGNAAALAALTAPAAGTPDPDSAQAIALGMVQAKGWGADQFNCLVALWNRESRWNAFAHNVSSGAYGIPQALPGSKMASAGADWQTNPRTQITWGLGYIEGRYGSPCGAWAHSEAKHWY